MLKVGLTGGYATGKSFVAAELHRLGCYVIYADKLGHHVLDPAGEAYQPTVELFGREILASDATIDRKRLAKLVFASPQLLNKLNAIVHPAVFRMEEKMLAQHSEKQPNGIAVIEAAILIETGRYRFFDRLILTFCAEETQIARGVSRDHLTRDQVLDRLQNQLPLEHKKPYANYLINTDMPKSETSQHVERIFLDLQESLKAMA